MITQEQHGVLRRHSDRFADLSRQLNNEKQFMAHTVRRAYSRGATVEELAQATRASEATISEWVKEV